MRNLPLQGRGSSSQLPQLLILLQAPPIVDTVNRLCQRASRYFGGKHDTAQSDLNMHLAWAVPDWPAHCGTYTLLSTLRRLSAA
jgi:hypothetical protein